MQNDVVFAVLSTLLGTFFMAWTSSYCRRMRSMGGDFSRRIVMKILDGDAAPDEVDEEITHLRGRLFATGLALLGLAAALLASCLMLWLFDSSLSPLYPAGLASLSLCLALSAFILRGSISTA